MDLSDWEEHFGGLLEGEAEKHLEKSTEELLQLYSTLSPEHQKEQTKEEIMRTFRLEDATEQIDRALSLVGSLLPQRINQDEWEACLEEFLNCDVSLCMHLEAMANGEIAEDEYVPIHQMLGLSMATLKHCYDMGQALYAEKNFNDASCLFGFLTSIAPYMPEFWVSLGMSLQQMEQYQDAIATYQTAQELFPDDPAMYIHSANNHIALRNGSGAKIQLDKAKRIFDENPDSKATWERLYDYLCSRAV